MQTLSGKTALVTGADGELGRAIALALSARGVRIVVTGERERPLGETVGEVVHGGGKARHVAGDASDPVHLSRAVERCIEVFGSLEIVVAASANDAEYVRLLTIVECTFQAAVPRMTGPGRLFGVGPGLAALCRATAERERLAGRKLPCLSLAAGPTAEPEDVAALLVALCAPAAGRLSGLPMTLG